jgi:aspartate-semialdehyde dehydrogenase
METEMTYNVAVVGATGNVGKELLSILAERDFPVGEVFALASSRSAGKEVSFGEHKTLIVQDLAKFDFSQADIGLFSAGASISKEYAPKAAEKGCVVIDNTSFFRMDKDVPLVVPEVNPDALKDYKKRNIIANPNCSTIQMVVALKPLHDIAKIKRVVVSTYQSVSGGGKEAMDELYNQTKKKFVYQDAESKCFSKDIAFNVIPQIDVFMEDGATKEEWKMQVETKKILGDSVEVSATCVRIPCFIGHAESVNIEFEKPISAEDAREIMSEAPGVLVVDDPTQMKFITPIECVGEDAVFVSRIRKDSSRDNALSMWVVSDNVRKGAALNTVQIAEELIENHGL